MGSTPVRARSSSSPDPSGPRPRSPESVDVREEVGALADGRRAIDEEHDVVGARVAQLEDLAGLDDEHAPALELVPLGGVALAYAVLWFRVAAKGRLLTWAEVVAPWRRR